MNERVSHHRVVSDVLRDAQTSASRSHKSVKTLEEELESNGYSVMVSAEGHSLVNERLFYHRAVLSVPRDAQTYELQSRTHIQKLR